MEPCTDVLISESEPNASKGMSKGCDIRLQQLIRAHCPAHLFVKVICKRGPNHLAAGSSRNEFNNHSDVRSRPRDPASKLTPRNMSDEPRVNHRGRLEPKHPPVAYPNAPLLRTAGKIPPDPMPQRSGRGHKLGMSNSDPQKAHGAAQMHEDRNRRPALGHQEGGRGHPHARSRPHLHNHPQIHPRDAGRDREWPGDRMKDFGGGRDYRRSGPGSPGRFPGRGDRYKDSPGGMGADMRTMQGHRQDTGGWVKRSHGGHPRNLDRNRFEPNDHDIRRGHGNGQRGVRKVGPDHWDVHSDPEHRDLRSLPPPPPLEDRRHGEVFLKLQGHSDPYSGGNGRHTPGSMGGDMHRGSSRAGPGHRLPDDVHMNSFQGRSAPETGGRNMLEGPGGATPASSDRARAVHRPGSHQPLPGHHQALNMASVSDIEHVSRDMPPRMYSEPRSKWVNNTHEEEPAYRVPVRHGNRLDYPDPPLRSISSAQQAQSVPNTMYSSSDFQQAVTKAVVDLVVKGFSGNGVSQEGGVAVGNPLANITAAAAASAAEIVRKQHPPQAQPFPQVEIVHPPPQSRSPPFSSSQLESPHHVQYSNTPNGLVVTERHPKRNRDVSEDLLDRRTYPRTADRNKPNRFGSVASYRVNTHAHPQTLSHSPPQHQYSEPVANVEPTHYPDVSVVLSSPNHQASRRMGAHAVEYSRNSHQDLRNLPVSQKTPISTSSRSSVPSSSTMQGGFLGNRRQIADSTSLAGAGRQGSKWHTSSGATMGRRVESRWEQSPRGLSAQPAALSPDLTGGQRFTTSGPAHANSIDRSTPGRLHKSLHEQQQSAVLPDRDWKIAYSQKNDQLDLRYQDQLPAQNSLDAQKGWNSHLLRQNVVSLHQDHHQPLGDPGGNSCAMHSSNGFVGGDFGARPFTQVRHASAMPSGPVIKLRSGGSRVALSSRMAEAVPQSPAAECEDAFAVRSCCFAVGDGCERSTPIGVIHSGAFTDELVTGAVEIASDCIQEYVNECSYNQQRELEDPRSVLRRASDTVRSSGAASVLLGMLNPCTAKLTIGKMGDIGYLVLRPGTGNQDLQVVSRWTNYTPADHPNGDFTQTYFTTSQDLQPSGTWMRDCHVYTLQLQPSDVIIAATDGFFDAVDVFGHKGAATRSLIRSLYLDEQLDPGQLAEKLLLHAWSVVQACRSNPANEPLPPFMQQVLQSPQKQHSFNIMPEDDIAVVVCYVLQA